MKTKPRQSGSSRRPSRLGLAETERPCRSSGLTLTEMVVVVSIIAVFTVLGLPAIRAFIRSVESGSSARAMISAALSSGRAIAAKEQHYAGVRFQYAYYKDDPNNSPLKAPQYMIFIINDTEIGPGEQGNLGCRAVEGIEPIKLPDSVGVMEVVNNKDDIISDSQVTDKTTFSILFSPSGKLVIHKLWVRNRNNANDNSSKDDIFNTETNIRDNKIGMFVQDEDTGDLKIELSQSKFRIYDRDIFGKVDKDSRYDDYLKDLEVVYINPYTGTMINK
jgi:prepilin-type N-terminal cleavage/methylation domain-containing protein